MIATTNMWSILSRMGSVESKLHKGGYHTAPFNPLVAALGPINHEKQFPIFKATPSTPCRHSYSMVRVNSSPQPQEAVTKNNNQACKKKKRRRRRKKKKSKNRAVCGQTEAVSRRQRQLSTASEDSFVICFDEDCGEIGQISELSENETVEDLDSSDSAIAQKKVRFADDSELCEVHPMVKWAYAYQAARKGPWEEYARDRDRFQKRVISTEADIGHVFAPEHRARIYYERFAC